MFMDEYLEAIKKVKELEAEVKSLQRYKGIIKVLNAGVVVIETVCDDTGKIVDCIIVECNATFEKQMELECMCGKSMGQIPWVAEEFWMEVCGKVISTSETIYLVKEFKTINKWFGVDVSKIHSDDRYNVAFVFKEITDKINLIYNLENTLKVQDEIFANVSHELKTPLSVIFGTSQLLELYSKKLPLEGYKEKIDKSVSVIKQNCYRFTKLINNIVDLSKMDSGFFKLNVRSENIVEVVENVVQSVADYVREKGLCIIFDTDYEERIINFDPEKIERVMLNLISNAIKFSDKGGFIYVYISNKEDFVEISIKDTGIGIDKKNLELIFKRFQQVDKSFSRNAEGSGIGLSLVKSIVDLHGGKVSVESELGQGSTFKIELPTHISEDFKSPVESRSINDRPDLIDIELSDIYGISPYYKDRQSKDEGE